MSELENNLRAANAQLGAGRLDEAEAIFRRILAANPQEPRALAGLGAVASELRRFDEAIELFESALEIQPNSAPILVRLGNALQSAGRFKVARAALEKAVELAPEQASPHYYLATLLAASGAFDQAHRHARRAVELDPHYGPAYQLLGSARAFGTDPALIEKMEGLAADGSTPKTTRMHIHYALGRIRLDEGDIAEGFANLEAANRIEREACDYDASDMADYFAFLRNAFDARALDRRAAMQNGFPRPIFIVGLPRSGTTLIEQILSSHSQVFGAGELTYLNNETVLAINEMAAAPFPKSLANLSPQHLGLAAKVYYEKIARHASGAAVVTDKNPANFQLVGLIHMLFPDARIIHLRRHPMDVGFSIYKHYFGQNTPYYCCFEDMAWYFAQYERMMDHWRVLLPGHILDIAYEDLVLDFEVMVRRLVDFCGLEWEDACLRFHENPRVITTMSKAQVRRPIYRTSLGAWKKFEKYLRPLAKALEAAGIDVERTSERTS